jgi:hypothetical protein
MKFFFFLVFSLFFSIPSVFATTGALTVSTTNASGTYSSSIDVAVGETYYYRLFLLNPSGKTIKFTFPANASYDESFTASGVAPTIRNAEYMQWTSLNENLIYVFRVTLNSGNVGDSISKNFSVYTDAGATVFFDVSSSASVNIIPAKVRLLSVKYYDILENGKLDTAKLSFSDAIEKINPANPWSAGMTISPTVCQEALPLTSAGILSEGDTVLSFDVSECSTVNTDDAPDFLYESGSGNITGVTLGDMATILSGDLSETEEMTPFLFSFPLDTDEEDTVFDFVFSEGIQTVSVTVDNEAVVSSREGGIFKTVRVSDGPFTIGTREFTFTGTDFSGNVFTITKNLMIHSTTKPTLISSLSTGTYNSKQSFTLTSNRDGKILVAKTSKGGTCNGLSYSDFLVTADTEKSVSLNGETSFGTTSGERICFYGQDLSLNESDVSFIDITLVSSGGGGGGGSSAGSLTVDTTTVFILSQTPSDTETKIHRPVQISGIITRPLRIFEYYSQSEVFLEKDTELTDASGNPFSGVLKPIKRSLLSTTPHKNIKNVLGSVSYSVFDTEISFSKPVEVSIKVSESLKTLLSSQDFSVLIQPIRTENLVTSLIIPNGFSRLSQYEYEDGVLSFFTNEAIDLVFVSGETSSPDSEEELDEQTVLKSFSDTKKHWAKSFIDVLSEKGIVSGIGGSDRFAPDEKINRAAFLKMALLSAGRDVTETQDSFVFSDVNSDEWYSLYVSYAYENNIVSGYEENGKRLFKPEAFINRAEALKIIMMLSSKTPETLKNLPFTDVLEDVWYFESVKKAYNLGIVSGKTSTIFDPGASITRAETAKILSLLFFE